MLGRFLGGDDPMEQAIGTVSGSFKRTCPDCRGSMMVPGRGGKFWPCLKCKATGKIAEMVSVKNDAVLRWRSPRLRNEHREERSQERAAFTYAAKSETVYRASEEEERSTRASRRNAEKAWKALQSSATGRQRDPSILSVPLGEIVGAQLAAVRVQPEPQDEVQDELAALWASFSDA